MRKYYPLCQLSFLLSLFILAESLNRIDLQYSERLRELCDNNNLTYFQYPLQKTNQGNTLYVYGITDRNGDHSNLNYKNYTQFFGKQAIFITGVMHPREDTSFIFIQRAIQRLVNLFKEGNQEIKYLLSRTVILIMPFVNIDGIKYSFELPKDKILDMRKNLDYTNLSNCKKSTDKGVDINRNFDYNFGTQKTSLDQCGQEYHGKQPFSEPETRSIREIFENFHVTTNIDVHSYGNLWIYPYASQQSTNKVQNHQLYGIYKYVFNKFKQIKVTYANCYQSLKYLADGVYIDWALQKNSLSFALQFGDYFDEVGNQLQKQIQAFIQVLKINTAAFEFYFEVDRTNNQQVQNKQLVGQTFNEQKNYRLCIKSFSTVSHNVSLVIENKKIQSRLISSRSNECFQVSFTSYLKQEIYKKNHTLVQIWLSPNYFINIQPTLLEQKFHEGKQQQKFVDRIWSKFKLIFIIGGIFYLIGSLCGLSVFCQKAFGLTLHQEQKSRLSSRETTERSEVYLEQSNQQLQFQKGDQN